MTTRQRTFTVTCGLALAAFLASPAAAQVRVVQGVPEELRSKLPGANRPEAPVPVPPSYTIGVGDVLTITVWRETDPSGEVTVRPDGKVTMKLGKDIFALGLTTEQLRDKVIEELKGCCFADPTVYVQVKEIRSRNVYIEGAVNRPGPYPLVGPMTIGQLIATAGGLQDFADAKHIVVVSASLKNPKGEPMSWVVNYDDIRKAKNLAKNNIELRPGDQVFVR